ncbi:ferrous iron transport protein A [Alkalinema pantanalense CENA528]|uniref:ferrous iron transport protein A n=1 Tax=Alkalinema pantanalense TaxID=1620705 RepID=UPI003D6F28E7
MTQDRKRRITAAWQGFVYFGESIVRPSVPKNSLANDCLANENPAELFPVQDGASIPLASLASKQVGNRVRIVTLDCGDANNRLMGMGFMPNVMLEIVSCTITGSVIVALQDNRLGLGAEMAKRIYVADVIDATEGKTPIGQGQFPHQTAHTKVNPPPAQPATRISSMSLPPSSSPNSTVKLRDVAIGARLRVVGYEPTARDYKRKLLAMGLTPGTELQVTRHAPLGDPTAIQVRSFHLSLRKAEADALMVEFIEPQ